jgi:hypothetical protein
MSESERVRLAATATTRAAELIADFMARHDAWREQALTLARHRDEVRAAAEREAAALVAKARADIKRTLVDTRRELTMLETQLRAVGEPLQMQVPASEPPASTQPPDTDSKTLADSVAAVRRDLHAALADARPELDELAALSGLFAGADRSPHKVRPLESLAVAPQPSVTPTEEIRGLGHGKKLAIVIALLASPAVPITAWRLTSHVTSTSRPAPAKAAVELTPAATAVAAPAATAAPVAPSIEVSDPASPAEKSTMQGAASTDRQTWLWLVVEARRAAWIQATTDGRTEAGRVLKAGEGRRILASRSMSIVVGDAGAVTLAFNGGKAVVAGRDGQVVTRRFTADDATALAAAQVRSGTAATVTPSAITSSTRGAAAGDARSDILGLSRRWLDGYYRRDNNTMAYVALPDVSVIDEREVNEKLTQGLTQVDRTLGEIRFDQQDDNASLDVQMIEQGDIHGFTTQVVSRVRARWRRQADRWRLAGVRIAADPKR